MRPLEVWAPRADRVRVVGVAGGRPSGREADLPADPARPGWFAGDPGVGAGGDYLLRLDDGGPLPDPRARWLPDGVHGPARRWDPGSYAWADAGWAGRALGGAACVYELHVGTFTPGGTLDAAAAHLPDLAALGVTHVELMPLAAFDGTAGWGYDGVALDAVHAPYGGPDALCRFVDAAHAAGLAVLLDVVHNHLGPSGNRWEHFGPFLTDAHHTPWGMAVNLDAPGSDDVRALLLGSALGWLRDFHLDGLRLDAVHELRDDRALTFLEELAAAVDALGRGTGRPLTVVAESDRNDPRTVTPAPDGGLGLTAQWDDDVHHALHWLLTGETAGYYADFGSPGAVARALERGFRHAGEFSSFRGRAHGRPADWTRHDPWRLVVALQTHDQVGNRAAGGRLAHLAGADAAAAGAALLLTLPYTPMLFMGEEWGASTPWCFFSSFGDPDLARAVTQGRRAEFSGHGWDGDVPDPQSPATAASSRLRREERAAPPHADLLAWYARLLALRAAEPGLAAAAASAAGAPDADGTSRADGLRVRCGDPMADGRPAWVLLARGPWRTLAALDAAGAAVDLGAPVERVAASWRDAARADGAVLSLPGRGAAVARVRSG